MVKNVIQINGGIREVSMINVMYVKNIIFGILLNVVVKMDLAITCDTIIELYDEEMNFNENKAICKTQNFYILHAFLLISFALLTVVNIYCYRMKNE